MIRVVVTVIGESDTTPLRMIFDYPSLDEEIFHHSIEIIRKKVDRNLKINVIEALTLYCAAIVASIRAGKRPSEIEKSASRILNEDDVMIGVPETLQSMTFVAKVDSASPVRIELKNPIPFRNYLLAE